MLGAGLLVSAQLHCGLRGSGLGNLVLSAQQLRAASALSSPGRKDYVLGIQL